MSPEEFLAIVVAVKRYLEDKRKMPNEIVRGVSYWRYAGRVRL